MGQHLETLSDVARVIESDRSLLDPWNVERDAKRAGYLKEIEAQILSRGDMFQDGRIISRGNVYIVLPSSANHFEYVDSYGLARNLVEVAQYPMRQWPYSRYATDHPLITVMFSDAEEMAKLHLPDKYNDVMSLTFFPTVNTLNLAAANEVIRTLGKFVGEKAVMYSFLHELGHLIVENYRRWLTKLDPHRLWPKGAPLRDFAGSFRRIYEANSVICELAACEFAELADLDVKVWDPRLGRNIPVFPDYVARLAPSPVPSENKLSEILATNNIDAYEEWVEEEHPGAFSRSGSFVASPIAATGYALWRDTIRSKTHVNMTTFLQAYMEHSPMISEPLSLPKEVFS